MCAGRNDKAENIKNNENWGRVGDGSLIPRALASWCCDVGLPNLRQFPTPDFDTRPIVYVFIPESSEAEIVAFLFAMFSLSGVECFSIGSEIFSPGVVE